MTGQRISLGTLAINALRPGYLGVMVGKLWLRLKALASRNDGAESMSWCGSQAVSLEEYLVGIDSELWAETLEFQKRLEREAAEKLGQIDIDLGGGGDYRLLYFMVRYHKPKTVVETGVAAGFSTQAILSAIAVNGIGHLYSSDFPYFRIESPERYVGYLVDKALTDNWTLFLEGDRRNLARILDKVEKVDFFHYDSDKSKAGRQFAMTTLKEKLTDNATVIMDDIQDDMYFHDFVGSKSAKYRIFAFTNKYLGLIEP